MYLNNSEYRLFLHSNVQHEYCLQITSPVGMSPPSVRTGGGTVCRVSFAQRAPSPRGCTGGTSWSVCQSGIARSSCCRTCSPPVCCTVGAGVVFVRLWVVGRKWFGAAPLAIRATTVTSTPLSAPSASSTPAASPRGVCPSREDFSFPFESD